jgi:hydroxymethylglutaryl-CoA lyase
LPEEARGGAAPGAVAAAAVTLCECFARDGLQHEPAFVPTDAKLALIERFAALGFPRMEVTSYANPARRGYLNRKLAR